MYPASRIRTLFPAVVATALISLTGCAGGQPADVAGPTTPATGAATVAPSAGGGTATTGGAIGPATTASTMVTLPNPAPTFPTTARAYAEATVAAWASDNLNRLSELTTPGVHEQFIEIPGNLDTDWIYVRCDGAAGSTYCTLRNGDGDSVTLRVSNQYLGKAHAVAGLTADLTTYPSNGEAYASAFVRAWAAGNTPRMRALATPDVVVAVNNNHQNRPQGTYLLSTVGEHGGAGLLIVHVSVNEGSVAFTLDVGTTLLGTPHAIVGYQS